MQNGILHACFMERSGIKYCLIQLFEEILGSFDEAILNDIDCPLLTLTKRFLLVPPSALVCAVSICHQCSSSCTLIRAGNGSRVMTHDPSDPSRVWPTTHVTHDPLTHNPRHDITGMMPNHYQHQLYVIKWIHVRYECKHSNWLSLEVITLPTIFLFHKFCSCVNRNTVVSHGKLVGRWVTPIDPWPM